MSQHLKLQLNRISLTSGAALLLSSLSFTAPLHADMHSHGDHLQIPVASQAKDKQHVSRPSTGLSGEQVVEQYGEPLTISPAVGEPPISRWEFTEFYVYFEYDRVIRSVMKHR